MEMDGEEDFWDILAGGGVRPLALPEGECLSKLIRFGEPSLRRALTEFTEHYHAGRNHQGNDNLLLFPSHNDGRIRRGRTVACRERLGGLLKYYRRTA